MTEVKQKIAQKTASKNTPPVSSKQKAQNTQAGGPTIAGVAGVGKSKTVTRPKSSQSTKTPSPHGVRTGPMGEGVVKDDAWFHKKATETAKGMGWPAHLVPRIKANMIKDHEADKAAKKAVKEGKENEFTANHQISQTIRGKMQKKLEPKSGMSDYYAHNDKRTSVKEEFKVGHKVRVHAPDQDEHGLKGVIDHTDEHGFHRVKLDKPIVRPAHGGESTSYYVVAPKKHLRHIKEDGGAPAMSVSGGAVPSITNATANYAFQVKKKVKNKMARRKKPV